MEDFYGWLMADLQWSMWAKQCHKPSKPSTPSPSQHFYRWNGYHSQSWGVCPSTKNAHFADTMATWHENAQPSHWFIVIFHSSNSNPGNFHLACSIHAFDFLLTWCLKVKWYKIQQVMEQNITKHGRILHFSLWQLNGSLWNITIVRVNHHFYHRTKYALASIAM